MLFDGHALCSGHSPAAARDSERIIRWPTGDWKKTDRLGVRQTETRKEKGENENKRRLKNIMERYTAQRTTKEQTSYKRGYSEKKIEI